MRIAVVAAAICLSIVGLSRADDAKAAIRLDTHIPAQSLGSALKALAQDRNLQILYFSAAVHDVHTNGAAGELTTDEALTLLLSGTGLTYRYVSDRAITIMPASQAGAGPTQASPAPPTTSDDSRKATAASAPVLVAQSSPGQTTSSASTEKRPEGSSPQPILQEIIVTARKHEERMQDVALSITVIGSDEIERRGLSGMEDYLRSIPGVNEIDNGALSNAIVIRGISTSPEFENANSGTTVASYFDEAPITGAAGYGQGGIDLRPVDIERIEVLRGPQGTAFGDASLGGTMRMIPVRPQLNAFSAKLSADYSNTSELGGNNTMVQGILNVPVIEGTFALRAVGYRYDDSGFYRNVAGSDPALLGYASSLDLGSLVAGYQQNDVGRMVTTGGRAAALWQPTDKLNLSLNFLTQQIKQAGSPFAMVGTFEQSVAPIAPAGRVDGQSGEVIETNIHLTELVVNYDLNWAALTAAGSWVDANSEYAIGGQSGFQFFLTSTTAPSDHKEFTGELRLASHLSGGFQIFGGLFYEHLKEDYSSSSDWPGTEASNPLGGPPTIYFFGNNRSLDQRAIFGEASYDLTSQLTATLGARYFRYNKEEQTLAAGSLIGVPLGTGTPAILGSSEGHSIYKASLRYKPTDQSMLYATWSQGFRLGRPDIGAIPALCDPNNTGFVEGTGVSIASTRHIDSDYLDTYEVGGKFALFDHRMTVDAAVYHINWTGLPIAVTVGNSGCGYTANAGAAHSDGAEFQSSFLPLRNVHIDLGGGYTKAQLSKDAPSLGASAGSRLPGSPRFTANVAAQYDFNIAGRPAFLRADSFYTSALYGDLQQTPFERAGDYAKLDARAGIAINKVQVQLFVHNLTNEDAYTWRGQVSIPGPFFGYRLRPRTIGVQLGYSFE